MGQKSPRAGATHHFWLPLGLLGGGHCSSGGQGLKRRQRDAGVAKRAEHSLKLRVGHKPQMGIVLLVEAAEAREFGCLAFVQLGHHSVDQSLHSPDRFRVSHAMLGHQLVGHEAVIGGQTRVEEHVTRRRDNLLLGFVVPGRTRIAHKATQPRKHDAIVVPKHARQRLKHVSWSQRGSVTK